VFSHAGAQAATATVEAATTKAATASSSVSFCSRRDRGKHVGDTPLSPRKLRTCIKERFIVHNSGGGGGSSVVAATSSLGLNPPGEGRQGEGAVAVDADAVADGDDQGTNGRRRRTRRETFARCDAFPLLGSLLSLPGGGEETSLSVLVLVVLVVVAQKGGSANLIPGLTGGENSGAGIKKEKRSTEGRKDIFF
jgi:hypothetical protein